MEKFNNNNQNMKNTVKTVAITLVTFGIYFLLDETYFKTLRNWINGFLNELGVSHIISYAIVGIPILLGTILMHGEIKLFESLGLDKSFARGLIFALLCTLPMFIGFALFFDFNNEFSLKSFLITVIAAAFFEELYFRGFLFGQIYQFTKWGFIPSVLIGAIWFGLIHLYQGSNLNEMAGVFLVTFFGGILFAWVFVEWNYNIWVPICLHLFMNLAWGLFAVSENALGGMYGNIFRTLTILLIIVLTIVYKIKKGLKLEVNKKTLLMK